MDLSYIAKLLIRIYSLSTDFEIKFQLYRKHVNTIHSLSIDFKLETQQIVLHTNTCKK